MDITIRRVLELELELSHQCLLGFRGAVNGQYGRKICDNHLMYLLQYASSLVNEIETLEALRKQEPIPAEVGLDVW